MAARKQSMVPSEGRRKSIYQRKPSVDGNRSINLDLPVGGRRPSMDGRRMSIIELQRKQSMADSLAGRSGLIMSADKNRGMNVKLENTYKLDPDAHFPISKAKKIANDVLSNQLSDKEYNKEECKKLSKTISDTIKHQVKALGYPRFKVVTIVAIGQSSEGHPSLSFTSRCMWNDKLDNFAEATFKSKSLYAVALCYVTYVD